MKQRTGVFAAILVVFLGLASAHAASSSSGNASIQIKKVMDQPRYAHSRWGMLVEDARSGTTYQRLNANQFFVPGSVTKLFTMSTAWNTLGPNHRFVTPVYKLGTVANGTLTGNLVLVASGDVAMGGRTKPNGTLDIPDFDQADANAIPGYATLVPEDPLAGLNGIAQQVRQSGITHVRGNVLIDNRLFEIDRFQNPSEPVSPIMINENLIAMVLGPTSRGRVATLSWRPRTAAYTVTSSVTTGGAKSPINLSARLIAPGQIKISGSVPAGHAPIVHTYQIQHPAAFARTAFIEALQRHGVQVDAPATGPNPSTSLPAKGSYAPADRVAAYTSPPYRQYAKWILKVSLNLGANLAICLLAVHKGSTDCEDGLPLESTFLKHIGVNPNQISLNDGQGRTTDDLVTPRAVVQLMRWWTRQPDFRQWKACLPILGVDGTLAMVERKSPARGHLHAKTGSLATYDLSGNRIMVTAKATGGYIDARDGRHLVVAFFMNNMPSAGINGVLAANNDLGKIGTILYSTR